MKKIYRWLIPIIPLTIAIVLAAVLLIPSSQSYKATSIMRSPSPGHTEVLSTATINCDANVTIDNEEQSFFQSLNAYRVSIGSQPLRISSSLELAASWKAQDMATHNYFSHTDSLGRDPFTMQNDCGYTYNTWKGETLAAGCESAACTLDLWQHSAPHDEILRNNVFNAVGIARVYDPNSSFGWYWAAEFGGVQQEIPPICPDYYPDEQVTIQDIVAFVVPVYRPTLNGTNYDARYDRNNDGAINSLDLLLVLPLWRNC